MKQTMRQQKYTKTKMKQKAYKNKQAWTLFCIGKPVL